MVSILDMTQNFIVFCFLTDISAHYPSQDEFKHTFYICGVLATIALIMINTVTNEQIEGGVYTEGCCGPQTARLWLFSGFILAFISMISSIWILFQYYVTANKEHKYPGVALFIQNILIFGSSLLLKYGRTDESF